MSENFNNEKWWDQNTMSYKNWDLPPSEREKNQLSDLIRLNQAYLDSNPYLKIFFNDLKDKKKKHKTSFDKVLDIGCGWGSSSLLLSNLYNEVFAIDISQTSIDNAYKNISSNQKKNINLEKKDAEHLELEEYFDFVYSWGVIHHSNNPKKIFQKVFKSLKKEGSFLIMVYNRNSLRFWFKGLYWLFCKFKIFSGQNIDSVQKYFTDGFYHKHYRPFELVNDLKEIGFKNIKFELTHMSKNYVPFIKKKSKIDDLLKKKFGWLLVVKGLK